MHTQWWKIVVVVVDVVARTETKRVCVVRICANLVCFCVYVQL